jgi:hypothetical protein
MTIGVVLREVAGRILEVPEEIRSDVVPAQSPDMPFRVFLQHGRRAATHLVHVIHFPCGVVQEVQRCLLQQQIVMIGRAAQERGQAGDVVGHLEPEPFCEEVLGGFLIQRAHDHMTEPARPHLVGAFDRRCPPVGAARASRPVGRFLCGRRLHDVGRDRHRNPQCRVRIVYDQFICAAVEFGADLAEVDRDPVEIVGIFGGDPDLQQSAARCLGDDELIAAFQRGEPASAVQGGSRRGESEVLVVPARRVNIRYPQRN